MRGDAKGKITLYSIWDNRTDELVVLDATAKKCSEIFGITTDMFYRRVSNMNLGRSKRWYIESRQVNKEDYYD